MWDRQLPARRGSIFRQFRPWFVSVLVDPTVFRENWKCQTLTAQSLGDIDCKVDVEPSSIELIVIEHRLVHCSHAFDSCRPLDRARHIIHTAFYYLAVILSVDTVAPQSLNLSGYVFKGNRSMCVCLCVWPSCMSCSCGFCNF